MTSLEYTSVPTWFAGAGAGELDVTGSSYLLVGVGRLAAPITDRWQESLGDEVTVDLLIHDHVEDAAAALSAALGRARVGVRVRLAGSPGACLTLRAAALTAGLEDDEIAVNPVGGGSIEVFCTHCRAVTTGPAAVGDRLACHGCARTLVVYHHVSRRSGQFMGFMNDAEQAVAP